MANSNDVRIDMGECQDDPSDGQRGRRGRWVRVLAQAPLALLLLAEFGFLMCLYYADVRKGRVFELELDKEEAKTLKNSMRNYVLEIWAFAGVWCVGVHCFQEGLLVLVGWVVSALTFGDDSTQEATVALFHLVVTRPSDYFRGTETPFELAQSSRVYWAAFLKVILQSCYLTGILFYYECTRSQGQKEEEEEPARASEALTATTSEPWREFLSSPASRLTPQPLPQSDATYARFLQDQRTSRGSSSAHSSTVIQIEAPAISRVKGAPRQQPRVHCNRTSAPSSKRVSGCAAGRAGTPKSGSEIGAADPLTRIQA